MKLAYANEDDLQEEGDEIAYQNDDMNEDGGGEDDFVKCGGTSERWKQVARDGGVRRCGDYDQPSQQSSRYYERVAAGGSSGGLNRYSSEAKKYDMSNFDNHLRFLQHIDCVKNSEQNSVKLHLEGVDVLFPMKPYQVQMDYMRKVLESCRDSTNALLESPTGTGKTLCLLTASLAWLKKQREEVTKDEKNIPRIIYCSRTHSQISQVADELKNTAYGPKTCLIGSRDQLCVNPAFKDLKGMALTAQCKSVRGVRRGGQACCQYYRNVKDSLTPNGFPWAAVQDIEDLHQLGKKHNACPYYLQRNRVEFADLILMPYNYLVDPKIRQNFPINFENSVIIIDEAHNIEKVAEEVAGFQLSINTFGSILAELSHLSQAVQAQHFSQQREANTHTVAATPEKPQQRTGGFQSSMHDVIEIITMTKNFQSYVRDVDLHSLHPLPIDGISHQDAVFPGTKIFDLFFQASQYTNYADYRGPQRFEGIRPGNFERWHGLFEKCLADLTNRGSNGASLKGSGDRSFVENWWDALKKVMHMYEQGCHDRAKTVEIDLTSQLSQSDRLMEEQELQEIDHYYLYIRHEDVTGDRKVRQLPQNLIDIKRRHTRCIEFCCFNPGLGFEKLKSLKPRSIILTSGTLAPLESFEHELMTEFPVKIENSHVIEREQANISVITRGLQGRDFNLSHKFRDNEPALHDLGETVLKIIEATPGGVLLFFPSYSMMLKMYDFWDYTGIIRKMDRLKGVYSEPRDSSNYKFVISSFYKDVYTRGAVMFAVCRGKISEGLDFSDDAARCVMLIGVPYPNVVDPKTVLKRHYLDSVRQNGLTGHQWYCQQATRAINQAIGRVIRHKNDYGNIVLIDSRFGTKKQIQKVSTWLRDSVQVFKKPWDAIEQFKEFFSAMRSLNLKPKVAALSEVRLDFAEADEDSNIRDAILDLRNKGALLNSAYERPNTIILKSSLRPATSNRPLAQTTDSQHQETSELSPVVAGQKRTNGQRVGATAKEQNPEDSLLQAATDFSALKRRKVEQRRQKVEERAQLLRQVVGKMSAQVEDSPLSESEIEQCIKVFQFDRFRKIIDLFLQISGNVQKLTLRTKGSFKEDDEVLPRQLNHIVCCRALLNILASAIEEQQNQIACDKYELTSASEVENEEQPAVSKMDDEKAVDASSAATDGISLAEKTNCLRMMVSFLTPRIQSLQVQQDFQRMAKHRFYHLLGGNQSMRQLQLADQKSQLQQPLHLPDSDALKTANRGRPSQEAASGPAPTSATTSFNNGISLVNIKQALARHQAEKLTRVSGNVKQHLITGHEQMEIKQAKRNKKVGGISSDTSSSRTSSTDSVEKAKVRGGKRDDDFELSEQQLELADESSMGTSQEGGGSPDDCDQRRGGRGGGSRDESERRGGVSHAQKVAARKRQRREQELREKEEEKKRKNERKKERRDGGKDGRENKDSRAQDQASAGICGVGKPPARCDPEETKAGVQPHSPPKRQQIVTTGEDMARNLIERRKELEQSANNHIVLSQFDEEELQQQQQKMDHLRDTANQSAKNMLSLLQKMPSNSSFAHKNPHNNSKNGGKASSLKSLHDFESAKKKMKKQRDCVSFGQQVLRNPQQLEGYQPESLKLGRRTDPMGFLNVSYNERIENKKTQAWMDAFNRKPERKKTLGKGPQVQYQRQASPPKFLLSALSMDRQQIQNTLQRHKQKVAEEAEMREAEVFEVEEQVSDILTVFGISQPKQPIHQIGTSGSRGNSAMPQLHQHSNSGSNQQAQQARPRKKQSSSNKPKKSQSDSNTGAKRKKKAPPKSFWKKKNAAAYKSQMMY